MRYRSEEAEDIEMRVRQLTVATAVSLLVTACAAEIDPALMREATVVPVAQNGCYPQYVVVAEQGGNRITIRTIRHKEGAPDGLCIVRVNDGPEDESVWGMLPATFIRDRPGQARDLQGAITGSVDYSQTHSVGIGISYLATLKLLSRQAVEIDGNSLPARLISFHSQPAGSSQNGSSFSVRDLNYLIVSPEPGVFLCYSALESGIKAIFHPPLHTGIRIERVPPAT